MMELAELRTVKIKNGGYERRAAERYETRLESEVKDVQRKAVAGWFDAHHRPADRMKILSLPDRYWTFENYMNDRPCTSFIGIQRDWTTLELSIPWMPTSQSYYPWADENRACHFHAKAATGNIQGYRRADNVALHMWAGHLLSWENLGKKKDKGTDLRSSKRNLRRVTATWLDFTGCLTDEVVEATSGIPAFLGGSREKFPVAISFLACRDSFRCHDERVAHILVALQKKQKPGTGWRFRFDRFEVHLGSSPFITVFGDWRFIMKPKPTTDAADASVGGPENGAAT